MALSKNADKRAIALAERFTVAGYRFLSCTASSYKYTGGLTRYVLEFDRPEYEQWDKLPGRHQSHSLYLDGADDLDTVTADPALLGWLCALVRRRKYERDINEVRHSSGYRETVSTMLDKAADDYGRWTARLFCAEHGAPRLSYSLDEVRANLRRATLDLEAAIAQQQERNAILDAIAPLPAVAPEWDDRYKIERIQSFNY